MISAILITKLLAQAHASVLPRNQSYSFRVVRLELSLQLQSPCAFLPGNRIKSCDLSALYRAQNQENQDIPFSESEDSFLDILLGTHLNGLSAPKSQRFLRFAIAMPIADPRNRAISETRESNVASKARRRRGCREGCQEQPEKGA